MVHNRMMMLADSGDGGTIITPTSNDTSLSISGKSYLVPTLTVEELTKAYNSIVAGTPTFITNKNGTSYFTVLQADSVQDVDILIEYYGIATLEYHLEGNAVDITAITQGGGGETKDLLWENASPSSTFNSQTIPMDITGYKFILVVVEQSNASIPQRQTNMFCSYNNSIGQQYLVFQGDWSFKCTRSFFIGASGAYFEKGVYVTYNTSGAITTSSSVAYAIPLFIYGIK